MVLAEFFQRIKPGYRFWLPVLLIVVAAAWLRLDALATYPQSFTQDEMVLGYDAWSLWHTGRDHHGELLPIAFRSFNDFVPPVATYLAAPWVGILGLDEIATRLPFAVLGIATVALVAILGRLWFGPLAGILAALFLAIDPWHLNYSRLALPASGIPFFITAALLAFTLAINRLKRADLDGSPPGRGVYGWLILSALAFALLTGSYPTMKIEAPLLILACLLATVSRFRRHRGLAMFWLSACFLFVSPLLLNQLAQWNIVQTRFNGISAFQDTDWLIQALRLYGDHFNPGSLLFTGFGNGLAVRRPLYIGELFWLEGPLWVAALVGLTRRAASRRVAFNLTILIGIWLITYPIADSLTRGAPPFDNLMAGGPHEIRSYNLVPLPELLAAFGVIVIWRKLARYRWGWLAASGLLLAGVAIFIFFCAVSLTYFFGPPLLQTNTAVDDLPWNLGFRTIMDKLVTEIKPCDTLWITNGNQMYMYYLFYTRTPPHITQQFDLTRTTGDWLDIKNFGQVQIGDPDLVNPQPIARAECAGQPQRAFYATRMNTYWTGWQEIAAVRNQAGAAVWRLLMRPLKYFTDGRLNDGDVDATMTGYCLPDGGIDIWAIDDKALRELYTVSPSEIQSALDQLTTNPEHQRIAGKDGRELWAINARELQFHDARGIVYNYIFAANRCNK